MSKLLSKECVPCEGNVPPLGEKEIRKYLPEVPGWIISNSNKEISQEWKFKDFKRAMRFVNAVAMLAEFEGHHPDIHIWYNKVRLDLSTHAIKGLSVNDFILAAKINEIWKEHGS